MRVTIIPQDSVIGVDGVFYQVDMTGVRAGVHAVQFDGAAGEIEFSDKTNMNEPIDDLTEFQVIIDRWQDAHNTATAPSPPPTLARAKALKMAEIERARDTAIFSDVSAHGRLWQADRRSQEILGQAITLAQAGLPLPEAWRDASNSNMAITSPADLLGIAGAVAQQTHAAYVKSWNLKAQVDAATTPAQVDAIVW